MRRSALAWLAVGVVLVACVAIGFGIVRQGFSARDEPSAIERFVARRVRSFAVPARARNLQNPVQLTPDVLAEARAHFADHCAMCHANNGSGDTQIGKNLYPKSPDMRLDDTQRLSDGELYYIIQNGIRLTGMPAWGEKDDDHDEDTWELVHFIRHLKDLTPEQLKEMEALNPKSPADLEEEKADDDFLRGSEPPAPHHKR